MIRHIQDPEHPNTLEELSVLYLEGIKITKPNMVHIQFTPTIPTCGMVTLIGLMIRVKLLRSLPATYKVDLMIEKGKHELEFEVNKQLNDKERVIAALEQPRLLAMVNNGLREAERGAESYLDLLKMSNF